MTSKLAAPGTEHPHPDHLMDYLRKVAPVIGPDYVRRTSLWLDEHYPATGLRLKDELRKLYASTRKTWARRNSM